MHVVPSPSPRQHGLDIFNYLFHHLTFECCTSFHAFIRELTSLSNARGKQAVTTVQIDKNSAKVNFDRDRALCIPSIDEESNLIGEQNNV